MIGDEISLLSVARLALPEQHVVASSKSTSTAHTVEPIVCTDGVGSPSQDSVLQIMSNSPVTKDVPASATLKDTSSSVNLALLLTDKKESQVVCSEENVSDIDLSFLNEAEGIISYPKHRNENVVRELQGMVASSQPFNLNFHVECSQAQPEVECTEGGGETVMIDVSQPIQLSQNSLIVVNGQKCVLQQDPQTGQVLAYPVREQRPPRRRRGRPRKISMEQVCVLSEKSPPQETEHLSEEEREKGLLEVFNDDGSCVRRSSRKRKKAKALKDYETGSLQQELGSDVDNAEDSDVAAVFNRRRKQRGPGRPRKYATPSSENISDHSAMKEKGSKEEGSQAFLVQTSDGQTLMLQVPLSSIPAGTTLQEVAHHIASRLTVTPPQAEEKRSEVPALQDHSIGSTTTQPPTTLLNEDFMGEEITLQCDQSLNDVTPSENLVEERNSLAAPESMEDNFCLDVSSTTPCMSVDAPLLGPFNEHLLNDHSFYVMKPPREQKDPFQEDKATIDPPLDRKTLPAADDGGTPNSMMNGAANSEVLSQEALCSASEKSVLIPIPPGPKKCKICAVPYVTEEEIIEHFKAKHPKCICLECHYMNEHPYGIKRHSYRHANEECVCHICHKKYKDSYILKMHVKMVHLPPEVLFRCEVCSKEFTRKAHLKRHQRIHAPLRQYPCPLCDYHGCERSDVTKHLLIHEEPKFKCEFCGKAFRHLKNKELHVKRHSGQRDYKCAACNFYGYTYTDIRKHIERRHSAVCHLCKQAFANPELCKEHKRLGVCQSSLLEAAKIGDCPPPTLDDKKEIVLFAEVALDIPSTL